MTRDAQSIDWLALASRVVRITTASIVVTTRVGGQVRIVPDEVTCARCSIELTPRFSLGEPQGGFKDLPLQVMIWTEGRRLVRFQGANPKVFAADGRFVRDLGRRGEGPGEFMEVAHLSRLPGDSLLVIDSELQRASVLGPDMRFVRSVSIPFYASAAAALEWPRIVAVNGMSYTPDNAGWPLHMLDFTASPARNQLSFGDNEAQLRAGESFKLVRKFFGASSTSFWAYHITSYQLTRYSRDGKIEITVHRKPPWFASVSPWSLGSPSVAPPPVVQAAAVKGETLWVAVSVPRSNWRQAWRPERVAGKRELTMADAPELSELYRTRIEVIDTQSGTLLAQRDFDGVIVEIEDDQLNATVYDLGPALEPRLRVFKLSLRR